MTQQQPDIILLVGEIKGKLDGALTAIEAIRTTQSEHHAERTAEFREFRHDMDRHISELRQEIDQIWATVRKRNGNGNGHSYRREMDWRIVGGGGVSLMVIGAGVAEIIRMVIGV